MDYSKILNFFLPYYFNQDVVTVHNRNKRFVHPNDTVLLDGTIQYVPSSCANEVQKFKQAFSID